MGRYSVRIALLLGVALFLPASRSQAQALLPSDPFQAYFGFYLPHQAAVAAQPNPLDTINAVQAARQEREIVRDRAGLYELSDPFSADLDPTRPYERSRSRERVVRPHLFPSSTISARSRGTAPVRFYNRVGQYYPNLNTISGQGPNKNLAVTRNGRGLPGAFSGR